MLERQTEFAHSATRTESILPQFTRSDLAFKRALDLTVGALSIIVSSPLMLILALLVRVTSPGPALFRQSRVGRNGELFSILKFRSMTHGTHDVVRSNPELWQEYVANDYKLSHDHQHVTKVGGFLRRTSLDELPQFFNVVLGDMSLVGVRPLVPEEFSARPERSQALYSLLRPGITGLWQVEGRSSVKHQDRIELDDRYVETWQPLGDVRLLFRTPSATMRVHHAS